MLLLLPLPPPPPPPPLPPPSSCCLCPPLPLPAIAPVSSLPPTPACRRSQGTYVTEGVHPPGSMWAMIPVPSQALGPRCIAGTNDTNSTPHACEPWEQGLVEGPCKPCPGTAGSDCSRCDNWWHGQTSCAAVSNPKLARRAAPRLTRSRSGPPRLQVPAAVQGLRGRQARPGHPRRREGPRDAPAGKVCPRLALGLRGHGSGVVQLRRHRAGGLRRGPARPCALAVHRAN